MAPPPPQEHPLHTDGVEALGEGAKEILAGLRVEPEWRKGSRGGGSGRSGGPGGYMQFVGRESKKKYPGKEKQFLS